MNIYMSVIRLNNHILCLHGSLGGTVAHSRDRGENDYEIEGERVIHGKCSRPEEPL